MLATPIARDLGVSASTLFARFSAAPILSALIGPRPGQAIDRWGGRPVLIATSLIFATGLGLLGLSRGVASLFVAWLVIGAGMGAGLYETAFSTLVRLYGRDARGAITRITLIAGFASTVGWPLSTSLVTYFGWRDACVACAGAHARRHRVHAGARRGSVRRRTAPRPHTAYIFANDRANRMKVTVAASPAHRQFPV